MGGLVLQMTGWLLLGSSTQSFQAFIPAVILLGMGVDASFFPCISAANIFPGWESSVIAVWGGARSASFYVIFIMESILGDGDGSVKFSGIAIIFACAFLGSCLILAALFIPMKPFPVLSQPFPVLSQPPPAAATAKSLEEIRTHSRRESVHSYMGLEDWKDVASSIVPLPTKYANMKLANVVAGDFDTSVLPDDDSVGEKTKSPSRRGSALGDDCRRSSTQAGKARRGSFIPIASASVAVLQVDAGEVSPTDEAKNMTRTERMAMFYKDLISVEYWPIGILFCFTLQRIIFFGSATDELLPDAIDFYKIVAPLSFLPCPLLGYLSDKYGILLVMVIVNFAGTMLIGFAMIPGIVAAVACQYLSILMYVIHVSFLLSQVYCYVADTFTQANMGKLIGLMCAVAGLLMLTAFPMYEFSLKNSFYPMMGMLLGTSVINFGMLAIVWWKKHR
eukprot:GHVQ01010738.1.p1 GENE.GHVQ01010738.1~~GHVQ01010738.1.p1  ORF type:complete len:449 (+),score=43.99 GHVQ01010738.1:4783-6129(+)